MKIHPFTLLSNSMLPAVNNGRAENISQLFDKIIKPQFNNIETIKQIHKSLMDYVNDSEPIFFVRLYGSYSKNKYHLQRRGFQSVYKNNIRVTFCDNTFTLLFTGMKLAGIPYSSMDLKNLFNQKKLVVGFGQVSEEKELSFYTPIGAKKVYLNTKGWYQAHIKPTGYGFDNLDLKTLFPNPPRDEFSKENKIRYVDTELNSDQNRILKAHFLRLIHPFNSFLVPKKSHIEYSGSNIGEEKELINFVRQYIKSIFPLEYKDFDKLSIEYKFDNSETSLTNIRWYDKQINQKQTNSRTSINENKKTIRIEKESIEYERELNLEKSLRAIGKEIFAIILYPELSKNIDVKYFEISDKYNKYNNFSVNSQRSRLSKAKAIFRAGLETKALIMIYKSNKIRTEVKSKILQYINNGS